MMTKKEKKNFFENIWAKVGPVENVVAKRWAVYHSEKGDEWLSIKECVPRHVVFEGSFEEAAGFFEAKFKELVSTKDPSLFYGEGVYGEENSFFFEEVWDGACYVHFGERRWELKPLE